jgi:hypothetical protein
MKKPLYASKEAIILKKKADDYIVRGMMLREIYDNVPKKFDEVYVSVMELHVIQAPKEIKKEVLKWLDKE